jgi:hypothetical protein
VNISRKVETDVNGRFGFPDLPAGSYSVTVDTVSGFVRLAAPKAATLGEGQAVRMTIRVDRSGAIVGRIQDEHGDGMLGAQVQAVRRIDVFGGAATLEPTGSATTNDLGEFRLFGLPAGDYYVVATYRRSQGSGCADCRDEPAPRSGYADTYYPGWPTRRGAQVVAVRGGRDSERVNFALARARLATLSVRLVDSGGVPLGRDALISLTRRDDVFLSSSTHTASRRDDGAFQFDGVQPGDYYLVATKGGRPEEAAYVNVSIRGADVSLNVRTNSGARVSGRIIIDGQPAADRGAESAIVFVSARPPLGKYGPTYARVPLANARGTDRFELNGLRGPMVLSAEGNPIFLLSIQRGGEEITGKTLEFTGTEVIDDVVITLTTKVAQVDVTVTNASSAADTNPVLVILFSDDPAQWPQGNSRYARTTAEALSFRVPPGRYLLAAIPGTGLGYPVRADVLERLRPHAMPVTLIANQTARVAVGVAAAAR